VNVAVKTEAEIVSSTVRTEARWDRVTATQLEPLALAPHTTTLVVKSGRKIKQSKTVNLWAAFFEGKKKL
jgi:hypothetical protein